MLASEVLVDDARTLHEQLTAAGLESRLERVERMDQITVTRNLSMRESSRRWQRLPHSSMRV
jgi:acetyl esterase/lipase